MTVLIIAFTAFTLVLGAYLWWAFGWSRWKLYAASPLVAFVVLLTLVWTGGAELLSRPKPLALEWRRPAQAEVLAARFVEDVAIYLWLALPDGDEPRAYILPWSVEVAKQILEVLRKGGQERGVMVDRPFNLERSLEDRQAFHPPPQPKAQPKDDQGTPEIFRREL